MGLLDEDFDEKYDIDIINRIFQLWIGDGGSYRACGFYNGIHVGKIKELPEDWMDWGLYHCTHLSNYGNYCCVIAPPNFEDEFAVYEPFRLMDWGELRVWDEGPLHIIYTVKDLLDWYENNN